MSTKTAFLNEFKTSADSYEVGLATLIQRPNQLKPEIGRLIEKLTGARFAIDALNKLLPVIEDGRDFRLIRGAFFVAFPKHASNSYRQGANTIWVTAEDLVETLLPYDRKS